jgi:hypothetical protein
MCRFFNLVLHPIINPSLRYVALLCTLPTPQTKFDHWIKQGIICPCSKCELHKFSIILELKRRCIKLLEVKVIHILFLLNDHIYSHMQYLSNPYQCLILEHTNQDFHVILVYVFSYNVCYIVNVNGLQLLI